LIVGFYEGWVFDYGLVDVIVGVVFLGVLCVLLVVIFDE